VRSFLPAVAADSDVDPDRITIEEARISRSVMCRSRRRVTGWQCTSFNLLDSAPLTDREATGEVR
jgi:hypothetical protein